MAELEDAPWAVKKKEGISIKPVDNLPDAPWAVEKPGVLEDVAKATPVGVAQGVIGAMGTPGDLSSLLAKGSKAAGDYLGDKLGFEKSPDLPEHSALDYLTSGGIQKQVEKVTGPFYQAQTVPGKIGQTAGQIAPMIAAGGEGVAGTIAKAIGGAATSEGAGEAANALKGHLPTAAQPWAEPVARAVGMLPGTAAPAIARRAVTPLPMSDARLAAVTALRGTNPELVNASSAGQLTESPKIAGLEARSPRMADLPDRQASAYTQGVMRQAGAPSGAMFDTPGLAAAKGNGAIIDTLQNANRMSPTEFNLLNRGVGQDRRELFREVGQSQPFDSVRDQIRNGPTGGNPPPLDMTGERYGALKQITQNAGEGAPTTHEQTAIFNARQRLQDAFHNSMPPEEAESLRNLDRQYSNFKTIENIPTKADQNTITPDKVFNKARRGSELEDHATQASGVMQPLPKPNLEGGSGTKVMGGILGGGVGAIPALLGHSEAAMVGAPFASYYGLNHLNDVVQALKNGAGRVAARPTVQDYLKNQFWRPGANSTAPDSELLARLLATPPVKQLGPSDQAR